MRNVTWLALLVHVHHLALLARLGHPNVVPSLLLSHSLSPCPLSVSLSLTCHGWDGAELHVVVVALLHASLSQPSTVASWLPWPLLPVRAGLSNCYPWPGGHRPTLAVARAPAGTPRSRQPAAPLPARRLAVALLEPALLDVLLFVPISCVETKKKKGENELETLFRVLMLNDQRIVFRSRLS